MKKPKIRIIAPIPTLNLPTPWGNAISLADKPMILLPMLLSPIMRIRVDMDEADWRTGLYWVVKKKWQSKLEFPGDPEYFNVHEPWGDLLLRTLELCDRCFDPTTPESQDYSSAANWYLQIIQEAKMLGQRAILANESGGKTPVVKERHAITKALRNLENPVNPQVSPHFHRLMDAALRLERSDEFNNQFWKPFLRACCCWNQLTDSPECQALYVRGNKIVAQFGRGRGKITIFTSL